MNKVSRTLTVGGVAFMTGIAAGVTTGLLSAPSSGLRTRRKLSRIARKVGSQTSRTIDQAKHRFEGILKDEKG